MDLNMRLWCSRGMDELATGQKERSDSSNIFTYKYKHTSIKRSCKSKASHLISHVSA